MPSEFKLIERQDTFNSAIEARTALLERKCWPMHCPPNQPQIWRHVEDPSIRFLIMADRERLTWRIVSADAFDWMNLSDH